jgi:hypothetical protein
MMVACPAMVALAVVITLGMMAVPIYLISLERRRRDRGVQVAATLLAGDVQRIRGGVRIVGTFGGVDTTVHYATRGSGNSTTRWTYVDCRLPAGYPLALHVRRHRWLDRGKVERGEMIDVVVGDPPFDDAFLVEGAPAEVVRGILSDDVRDFLLAHARVELETRGEGALRLAMYRWIHADDALRGALDCATAIAGAVRDATLGADAAAQRAAAPPEPAYRDLPADDRAVRAARAARAAEVEELEAARAERAARKRILVIAFTIVVVLVWAVMVVTTWRA